MTATAQLFKTLADETRLRILNLLSRGELCVCDITKILEVPQSKASRHLACLRVSGLVTDRREGLWMHYSLAPPTGALHRRLLGWLAEAEKEIPQGSADLRALERLRRCGKLCAQSPLRERNQAPRSGRRRRSPTPARRAPR